MSESDIRENPSGEYGELSDQDLKQLCAELQGTIEECQERVNGLRKELGDFRNELRRVQAEIAKRDREQAAERKAQEEKRFEDALKVLESKRQEAREMAEKLQAQLNKQQEELLAAHEAKMAAMRPVVVKEEKEQSADTSKVVIDLEEDQSSFDDTASTPVTDPMVIEGQVHTVVMTPMGEPTAPPSASTSVGASADASASTSASTSGGASTDVCLRGSEWGDEVVQEFGSKRFQKEDNNGPPPYDIRKGAEALVNGDVTDSNNRTFLVAIEEMKGQCRLDAKEPSTSTGKVSEQPAKSVDRLPKYHLTTGRLSDTPLADLLRMFFPKMHGQYVLQMFNHLWLHLQWRIVVNEQAKLHKQSANRMKKAQEAAEAAAAEAAKAATAEQKRKKRKAAAAEAAKAAEAAAEEERQNKKRQKSGKSPLVQAWDNYDATEGGAQREEPFRMRLKRLQESDADSD